MTIKERFIDFLTGGERRKLMRKVEQMREILLDLRSYEWDQRRLAMLGETDALLLDLIMRQRGYEPLYGVSDDGMNESLRVQLVKYSRQMTLNDPLQSRIVRMWTDFGFGTRVDILPDEAGVEAWSEFWHARRNRPVIGPTNIHRLSQMLLTDGEVFLVYFIALNGDVTVRCVRSDDIREIIYDEDDSDIPLYYVMNSDKGLIYYADWQANSRDLARVEIPDGAITADQLRPGTQVVMQHLAYDVHNGRGWPLFRTSWEWNKVYTQFLGDRAAVARKAAMYTEKIKIKGGSRTLDAIAAKLGSSLASSDVERNPAPVPASDWLENDAVERVWMDRNTGAINARVDGMMLMGQVSLATGAPLHWLGRPDSTQNRATARESMLPFKEQIERYQLFWRQAFEDMYQIVMTAAGIENSKCTISFESPIGLEASDVAPLLNAINAGVSAGSIRQDIAQQAFKELLRVAMVSLGSSPDVLEPPGGGGMVEVGESHDAEITSESCPLCGHYGLLNYPDHGRGGLRVCPGCGKTVNLLVEQ